MVRSEASTWRRLLGNWRLVEVTALAILAYVPFLLSSPGQLSSDTKQYLYLDPGGFLSRALYMWDPQVGAGTVPHQHIGYLFPMGPWFWFFDQIGAPDWIAQRLWWGTISLAAVLGARWLFTLLGVRRAGAIAGALVYVFTPYQLAFTARISVLLLPWAALPWLIGLAMRSVRRGGWRDPAIFALVTLTVGGVNAPTLLLVGIGPVLWLMLEACRGREMARRVLAATARIGVLTTGVSIWWVIGLRLQGSYGLPVLQLTESVRAVSVDSSPDDLLRGLGNWFFYGRDPLGFSIDQARSYRHSGSVEFFSFAIPVLGLASAAVLRWRHRAYFALLIVVGTVVGVGAWPYESPSPYGQLWKAFADTSSLGLALRNTARIAPVIVLGIAGLLAAAVGSLTVRRFQVAGAIVVSALAVGAFGPVWQTGYLSDGVRRPEEVPDYWTEAAAELDAGGNSTRVLEIPGANFAAYRWGNAVEPITPGLTDRPFLAREVLPYGSRSSVNLLDALDRRLQQGTFEPASLAPVARIFGVGTVALRSDLQYERFGTPRPRLLWSSLTDPAVPGLEPPKAFGPAERNVPSERIPSVDALELRTPPGADNPPPVALFDVEDAEPILHTASPSNPVVLAGDGDGIVDSAAVGLLDGHALLFEMGSLSDAELKDALAADADLVLTDSNRRRQQNWFASLRETMGATERAGQKSPDPKGLDFRLDPFDDDGDGSEDRDDSRTVVEHDGGRVDATGDGGAARPEDRAVGAFDADTRTAWRVGGADPTGQRLTLELDEPVTADRITLTQPQDGPRDRVLTEVRLRFDGGEPLTAELGPDSLKAKGQVVPFPERSVKRVEIELAGTTVPPFDPSLANAVGFAEIDLAGVSVTEIVRLPVDVSERIGESASGHRMDIVMSRLRSDPGEAGRQDQELALERRFELPDPRSFRLSGTARVNPHAPDEVIDSVLGTVAPGTTFTSSGKLLGDPSSRASRAFDGAPDTAWTAPIGPQEGNWIDAELPEPVTVDHLDLTIVADGRHSIPTNVSLEADGELVDTLEIPKIAAGSDDGDRHQVTLSFDPVQARQLRLVVDEVRRVTPTKGDRNPDAALPVAISEIAFDGLTSPAQPDQVPNACQTGLLSVDGKEIPVRLVGSPTQARTGLAVEACEGSIDLADSHRLSATPGLDTGIDMDRIALSSDADGEGSAIAPRGTDGDAVAAEVRVVDSSPTSFELSVRTNGEPFWLVLGQSYSEGWEADVSEGSLGSQQMVNGYANGWLVSPSGPGTVSMDIRWTPQRIVWVGLGISLTAVLACAGILIVTSRRQHTGPAMAGSGETLSDEPTFGSPLSYAAGSAPSWPVTAAMAVIAAVGTVAVARPWMGVVAGVAVVVATRVSASRAVLALAIPLFLVLSQTSGRPHLAWLSLALLVVDLAASAVHSRRR